MKFRPPAVQVPEGLLERARLSAREHNTALSRLIAAYLAQLATEHDPLVGAPIVKRLSGALSRDVTIEDDYLYLHNKARRAR